MNNFEELCKLASDENWCWDLVCTTCGHMHFRYAFVELASGKSPRDTNWFIHGRNTRYSETLGGIPRSYSDEQKAKVNEICCSVNLSLLKTKCSFPDWLGYLGLVLEHMYSDTDSYRKVSESWSAQLAELIPKDTSLYRLLSEKANGKGVLNIEDLEACEGVLNHASTTGFSGGF